jgi:hypothetical protein
MTQRSIAETLAMAIATAVPPAADLPDALADELAGMAWLSDKMMNNARIMRARRLRVAAGWHPPTD